ncbi:hypothetical protein BJX65DRAFT_321727 [Aspergillus insuetus]
MSPSYHLNGLPADLRYEVLEKPHSYPRPMRIICVGAGAGGLLLAYKCRKNLKNIDVVCYEKNSEVGGTWFENRYPGCACDVPVHNYAFSFEPNPNFSALYASSAELKEYFQGFAKKYELMPMMELNCTVKSAVWDDDNGIYNVKIERDGKVFDDWCNFLINGTGCLNDWKWPKIPGLHDFAGKLVHSAAWDDSIDVEGQTVGLIGTGSSAIQILPQIQKKAKHVESFMRSPTWIASPGFNMDETIDPKDAPGQQHYYTEEEKKRFRDDPEYFLKFRKDMEVEFNLGFDMFIEGTEMSMTAQESLTKEMKRRIGPGHEELKKRLIPTFPPGCRRMTPGDGYLESLVQPNVTTVFSEIAKVVPEGIIDENDLLHSLDILICATGFNLSFAPRFDLLGENGVTMEDEWELEPQCYLALTAPKFPNYFIINGPRGNWGIGSALNTHEVQVDYMVKMIKRIQAENIKSLTVKQDAVNHLYQHMEAFHERTVWTADCKSWYKNNIWGGKIWLWGGSALHYMQTIMDPKYEHYDFKYLTPNIFSYLGNGLTQAQAAQDKSKLSPYVRNSDTPWTLED